MKNPKIELEFSKLSRALISLEDIAFKPMLEDRSNIDASIQRFEFTIELFWKLLRVILKSKGVAVQYPKDVLREAFKGHLIDHEQEWLKMLLDRKVTSHTYDEQLADKIYNNIRSYIPILRSTFDTLNFIQGNLKVGLQA